MLDYTNAIPCLQEHVPPHETRLLCYVHALPLRSPFEKLKHPKNFRIVEGFLPSQRLLVLIICQTRPVTLLALCHIDHYLVVL